MKVSADFHRVKSKKLEEFEVLAEEKCYQSPEKGKKKHSESSSNYQLSTDNGDSSSAKQKEEKKKSPTKMTSKFKIKFETKEEKEQKKTLFFKPETINRTHSCPYFLRKSWKITKEFDIPLQSKEKERNSPITKGALKIKNIFISEDFLSILKILETTLKKNEDRLFIKRAKSGVIGNQNLNFKEPTSSNPIQRLCQFAYDLEKSLWSQFEGKPLSKMLQLFDSFCLNLFEIEVFYSKDYKGAFTILIEKMMFTVMVLGIESLITEDIFMYDVKEKMKDILEDYSSGKMDLSFDFCRKKSFVYTQMLIGDEIEGINESNVESFFNKYYKVIMIFLIQKKMTMTGGDFKFKEIFSYCTF